MGRSLIKIVLRTSKKKRKKERNPVRASNMFVFTHHPVLTPGSMPGMFYRPSTVFAGWMNESDEAQRRQEEKIY